MTTASRTMFGLMLGVLTVGAFGCGSRSQPEPAAVAEVPSPSDAPPAAAVPTASPGTPASVAAEPPLGPPAGTPPAGPMTPPPTHELDPGRHAIPAVPVVGRLAGVPFTPTAAVEGEYLVFQVAKPDAPLPEWAVRLKLGGPLAGRKLVVRPEQPAGPAVPEILVQTPKQKELQLYPNGYALTLELGTRRGGKLPGKVYLCLPDAEQSFFAGTFEADSPRQPTEPPGPDDVPLVNGTVTVKNAPTGAVVLVGYAAFPNPTTVAFGSAEIALGDPVVPPRWTQSVYDKPRVTSLIAGNGADVPSRYEHSKLTPGRYLVFAALKNGPAAWKWVDVPENGTVTVDLTIDAAQTGGVEVGVPLEAVGKVQLAPADEPGRPATDPGLFTAISLQLGLEQPVAARKALFKNLGPGRYEVRTAGRSAVVEVVAGKTIEFDFDKKAPPPQPEPAPEPTPKP